ncbi:MAG: leucine-rich repeat domain-containing protein [Prevotellaceae bacterium]|nr:leucine-rich repeat domain-containing protein [Prevotellaceae bacterium]
MTSIIIPECVTSLGISAFSDCSGLTSVTIPDSVTSISDNAFRNCSGLKFATIPNSVTEIGSYAFYGCSSLTSITIPEHVKSIEDRTFYGCRTLTSITIPNSVKSIGEYAFYGCSRLADVVILDGADELFISTSKTYTSPFSGCPIEKLYLGRNLEYDGAYPPFKSMKSITNLEIGDSVSSIGNNAFYGCSGLTEVTIPNSVTSIGNNAFYACYDALITIPNNIEITSGYTFYGCKGVATEKGTTTLLSLWNCGYTTYEKGTTNVLPAPYMATTSITQSSITLQAYNLYDCYQYNIEFFNRRQKLNDKNKTVIIDGLSPEGGVAVFLYASLGEIESSTDYRVKTQTFTTQKISPSISASGTSPSSISISATYIKGDAEVTSQYLSIKYNGNLIGATEGNKLYTTGLDPNTSYYAEYSIVANGVTYTGTQTINTSRLSLTTSQPKVVSLGNVIIAAESNLDDEETNVGFEWRRTDWNDDFASNTGGAYLYNGTMEGYIRNLNTDKLWKYRPYYLSNSGTYYYGDWVGLDPTNTSYFEPTVHTYSTINIEGNTALVKGYALTGTDKITVQGFKYWKSVASAKDREGANRIASIPSDAKTIEADGQVMTANLTGLDYNATYHYLAFVTTAEGDTFYGEEQVFTTGNDPTGIEGIEEETAEQNPNPVTIVARYNMNGQTVSAPQKGINILRMSDGTVKKVLVK